MPSKITVKKKDLSFHCILVKAYPSDKERNTVKIIVTPETSTLLNKYLGNFPSTHAFT
jgi:hypothetical protein